MMNSGGVDFRYFLNRKYALLGQEANAGTQNAASNAITARAQAGALGAAAALDRTRASLMPGESEAGIAQTLANARLLGEQAATVRPVAFANIRATEAGTRLTDTQEESERSLNVSISPDGKLRAPAAPSRSSVADSVFEDRDRDERRSSTSPITVRRGNRLNTSSFPTLSRMSAFDDLRL